MKVALLVILALCAAWVAVPIGYAVIGFRVAVGNEVERLGFARARVASLRTPCAGLTDYGAIVIYQKADGAEEKWGRMCREMSGKWVWYPSTNDLSVSEKR